MPVLAALISNGLIWENGFNQSHISYRVVKTLKYLFKNDILRNFRQGNLGILSDC